MRGPCGHRAGAAATLPAQVAAVRVAHVVRPVSHLRLRGGGRLGVAFGDRAISHEQVPDSGEPGVQAICR